MAVQEPRVFLPLEKCPSSGVLGPGEPLGRANAFLVCCCCSFTKRVPRVFLSRDVAVWLRGFLPGFGEVRVARASPRGLRGSHSPGSGVGDYGGMGPSTSGGEGAALGRERGAFGVAGIGEANGNSRTEPGKGCGNLGSALRFEASLSLGWYLKGMQCSLTPSTVSFCLLGV